MGFAVAVMQEEVVDVVRVEGVFCGPAMVGRGKVEIRPLVLIDVGSLKVEVEVADLEIDRLDVEDFAVTLAGAPMDTPFAVSEFPVTAESIDRSTIGLTPLP